MKKMYIAVLDTVPDFMVPTLVAHTILAAHIQFERAEAYDDWLDHSFKKVTLRVNQKEFDRIAALPVVYLGHENTTLDGVKSCAIPMPCDDSDRPNVLRCAKMWSPDQTAIAQELAAWKELYEEHGEVTAMYVDGTMTYVY
jgi:hypothetical protein